MDPGHWPSGAAAGWLISTGPVASTNEAADDPAGCRPPVAMWRDAYWDGKEGGKGNCPSKTILPAGGWRRWWSWPR
jgi:hypothetical protein